MTTHRLCLLQELATLVLVSAIAKTANPHRLWLLVSGLGLGRLFSYLVSFLMRLLNGGAVLLGASKFGSCFQAHQKGYLLNVPDDFYFPWSATGSSTGETVKSHEKNLLINQFGGTK